MNIANIAPLPTDVVEVPAKLASRSRLSDYVQLTKLRLSALVLLTTLVGFFFGSPEQFNFILMLDTLLGTALVAFGSSALNQYIERRSDARMKRTANRPLPSGRMSAGEVLYFGAAASIAGMLYLALRVNLEAAAWATLTLALYVFLYTPMKRVSSLNTLIGALPGALPPVIGWAACGRPVNTEILAIFGIIFIWQLPHFLAIAWMYRADYERAGLVMLPNIDPAGFSTGRQVTVHALTLLPVSLIPCYLRMAGPIYAAAAVALGFMFLGFGVNFMLKRTDSAARKLFLASVIYLPLLLAVMMFDS